MTEALARDNYQKNKNQGKRMSDSRREVSEFIQIIHRYRDNMLAKIKNPVENGVIEIDPEKAVRVKSAGYGEVEHVAIFDEAQRSWTHKRIANYLKRGGTYGNKLKVPNFPFSEAEFLIWSLDQREDWAVIPIVSCRYVNIPMWKPLSISSFWARMMPTQISPKRRNLKSNHLCLYDV